jgi:hypothetical protein
MKHEVYMGTKCLHCRDLEIYCKFRSSCAIHFMKKNGDLAAESRSAEGQDLEAGV